MIRTLLAGAAGSVAVALLAGHAGGLHPALDSFAHLRLQLLGLAALLALPCLAARAWNAAAILIAVAVGSLAQTVPYLVPTERVEADPVRASLAPHYTLLQQNLSFRNERPSAFLRRVADVQPDVMTLQEVHRRHGPLIDRLRARYPHLHRCRGTSPVGDVVVLSRRPFAPDLARRCTPGLAVVAVSFNGQGVAIGSLHLHWPWPFPQGRHIESLERHVPEIGAPGILAGDYNAVPWSAATARLADMMDGRIVRGIGATRIDPGLPRVLRPLWDLPIDNVAVTDFIEVASVASVPLAGSDHDSVVVRFRLAVPQRVPDVLVLR